MKIKYSKSKTHSVNGLYKLKNQRKLMKRIRFMSDESLFVFWNKVYYENKNMLRSLRENNNFIGYLVAKMMKPYNRKIQESIFGKKSC